MTDAKLITIGKAVAPHGVRGDVRVIPLTDFPDRFLTMKEVRLEDGRVLAVESAKFHKQFVILKFRGLDDRDAVDNLRGKLLVVNREELVKLPEGHYYIFDIVGLKVYDETGACLGTVTDVISTGSNDVYIAEQEGKKPLLIPALKDVVREIDVPGGRMTVRLQEEWD
ncbi:ribosome maturation factor RimM [Anaeroselena agilis]|uniref:Ribosome maturation factor RimM n=1 Tax=Anaeroselena agilis TaxID=3063788 RepID=A0ABU3NWQ8_9FIRM|nr:ribosome maturation factor RimM [Selenomonadales bacterium 4137-cl]